MIEKTFRLATCLAVFLLLSGCLSRQLKQLDIAQRQAQLDELRDHHRFVQGQPSLGNGYDARLFVSQGALNTFLAGMDNYQIPLETPRRAYIEIRQTRLRFLDGTSLVEVEAVGKRHGWPIEVRLRVLAQMVITPEPQNGTLRFTFRVQRILPDIRLSIFRLREWLFAQSLLRVPAQAYIDSLPAIQVPLRGEFALTMDSQNDSWVDAGQGRIMLRTRSPSFNLNYRYLPVRVLPLADGLHLMLRIENAT